MEIFRGGTFLQQFVLAILSSCCFFFNNKQQTSKVKDNTSVDISTLVSSLTSNIKHQTSKTESIRVRNFLVVVLFFTTILTCNFIFLLFSSLTSNNKHQTSKVKDKTSVKISTLVSSLTSNNKHQTSKVESTRVRNF